MLVTKVAFPPLNCFSTTLFTGSGEPPLKTIFPVTPSKLVIFENASRTASRSSLVAVSSACFRRLHRVVRQGGDVVRHLLGVPLLERGAEDADLVHHGVGVVMGAEERPLDVGARS